MQLDKTRIPIQERAYGNLLDLSLTVVRRHALGLLFTSLAGAVPCALLNYWLLSEVIRNPEAVDYPWSVCLYLFYMAGLVVWQIPLAAVPTTLYLGQALFLEKPEGRRLLRDFTAALPQLFWVQVALRGPLTLLGVGLVAMTNKPEWSFLGVVLLVAAWLFVFWNRPYLNEIILLERNPLAGDERSMTTFKRAKSLHKLHGSDLIGRWSAAMMIGGLWVGALWLTIFWFQTVLFGGQADFGPALFQVWLPVALWTVISYFHVVRFLSYLDLRIRGEGWAIELRMRAEANRIKSQLT